MRKPILIPLFLLSSCGGSIFLDNPKSSDGGGGGPGDGSPLLDGGSPGSGSDGSTSLPSPECPASPTVIVQWPNAQNTGTASQWGHFVVTSNGELFATFRSGNDTIPLPMGIQRVGRDRVTSTLMTGADPSSIRTHDGSLAVVGDYLYVGGSSVVRMHLDGSGREAISRASPPNTIDSFRSIGAVGNYVVWSHRADPVEGPNGNTTLVEVYDSASVNPPRAIVEGSDNPWGDVLAIAPAGDHEILFLHASTSGNGPIVLADLATASPLSTWIDQRSSSDHVRPPLAGRSPTAYFVDGKLSQAIARQSLENATVDPSTRIPIDSSLGVTGMVLGNDDLYFAADCLNCETYAPTMHEVLGGASSSSATLDIPLPNIPGAQVTSITDVQFVSGCLYWHERLTSLNGPIDAIVATRRIEP